LLSAELHAVETRCTD